MHSLGEQSGHHITLTAICVTHQCAAADPRHSFDQLMVPDVDERIGDDWIARSVGTLTIATPQRSR